jgi:zinc protease
LYSRRNLSVKRIITDLAGSEQLCRLIYFCLPGERLSENVDQALELLGDVVFQPTFPEEELAIERWQLLVGLQVELGTPFVLANRTLNGLLYGDHPYGQQPELAELQALTREDVTTY